MLTADSVPQTQGYSTGGLAATRVRLRRIPLPRSFDAHHNREAQQHNGAHRDPLRGEMQYDGSVDQPADQDKEADNVYSE